MVRTTAVRFIDDIDGSQAAETVRFAVDGQTYEIDLSVEHAQRLRQSLGEFIAAARRTGRGAGGSRPGRRPAGQPREVEPSVVRAWAAENGVAVSPRGRVPQDVLAKYRAAQHPAAASTEPASTVPAEPLVAQLAATEPMADTPKRSRRRRS